MASRMKIAFYWMGIFLPITARRPATYCAMFVSSNSLWYMPIVIFSFLCVSVFGHNCVCSQKSEDIKVSLCIKTFLLPT